MPEAASPSPISRLSEFWARLKNREKGAIISAVLILCFLIVFFVGFGYLAARVGPSDDYGVYFHKRLEQTFPAWALHTFRENALANVQCHHCHFKLGENCEAQPLVSYQIVKEGDQGQPITMIFNYNGAIQAKMIDHDYIHCEYSVTGPTRDAVVAFYDYGGSYAEELARGGIPESHLVVSLTANESIWIGLRHSLIRNRDGSEERSWTSATSGYHPSTSETLEYFNIFFEDYTTTIFHQNSKGLDMIDFWQFMGYVGGLIFLFWILFQGIMGIIGSCCGGAAGVDRTTYQQL